MYALSRVGGPETAAILLAALDDADERVRADAATGLARLDHPDALRACLRTLDDAPDELHGDMTPAVNALARFGMRAVPPLLDLLLDTRPMTRLHAQRALEGIVDRRHGFVPGQGFPSHAAEDAARDEWRANGNYGYDADEASRRASVAAWRRSSTITR
jgi:HEAT repeat protein